ncbi:MAG: HlyD family secretion protein, partial [Bacteroidota bacterium]
MKKLAIISAMIFLAACSGKNKKSDAYGNFEADEVIISSEVGGKLIHFDLEEGNVIDSGKLIGLVDTADLQLKKEQLMAQRSAIAKKSPNIASQIEVQNQQKSNLLIDKARIEKLYKDGAATKKQLDDINGSINLVEKQILSIQTQNGSVADEMLGLDKQMAQIDQNIKKSHLVNPIKGTVLDKYMMQNELV